MRDGKYDELMWRAVSASHDTTEVRDDEGRVAPDRTRRLVSRCRLRDPGRHRRQDSILDTVAFARGRVSTVLLSGRSSFCQRPLVHGEAGQQAPLRDLGR